MLVRVSDMDPYVKARNSPRPRTLRDFGVRLVVRGIEYWFSQLALKKALKIGKMNWRMRGHVASGMFVGSCDLHAKGERQVANMMYGFQNSIPRSKIERLHEMWLAVDEKC